MAANGRIHTKLTTDGYAHNRFVLTTLTTHNSQQVDVYMPTTDTVTHTMLTTDTQPRTQLHDVSWAVFDFA